MRTIYVTNGVNRYGRDSKRPYRSAITAMRRAIALNYRANNGAFGPWFVIEILGDGTVSELWKNRP